MSPPFALLSDDVTIGQCYFKKISHLHFIQSHLTWYLFMHCQLFSHPIFQDHFQWTLDYTQIMCIVLKDSCVTFRGVMVPQF